MTALFDINEYRHSVKQFQIQLLDRLFSMMYALMDLCIVRPENLKDVCSSEQFVSAIGVICHLELVPISLRCLSPPFRLTIANVNNEIIIIIIIIIILVINHHFSIIYNYQSSLSTSVIIIHYHNQSSSLSAITISIIRQHYHYHY